MSDGARTADREQLAPEGHAGGDTGVTQGGHVPAMLDAATRQLGAGVLQRKLRRRMAAARSRASEPGADGMAPTQAATLGTSGAGGPLPHLDRIQAAFGAHDVRSVQAHVDEPAAHGSRALGAEAFAIGDHVAFDGAPSLHTAAHEAAHVVQQRGGVQLQAGLGEEGDAYERHADAVADRVVAGQSAEALLSEHMGGSPSTAIQRNRVKDEKIHYGGTNSLRTELSLLPAEATLHAASKESSTKLAKLPAGRKVNVVRASGNEGWTLIKVKVAPSERLGEDESSDSSEKPEVTEMKGYVQVALDAIPNKPLDHAPADQGDGGIMAKEGPRPEDVVQHQFGDCFLLAPLMSLARTDPDKIKSGVFQSDPTVPARKHTVRFFKGKGGAVLQGPFTEESVTVDNTVLKTTERISKPDGTEMPSGTNFGAKGPWNWPALVEKAFTAWPGKAIVDSLDQGLGHRAAMYLTGEQHDMKSVKPDSSTLKKAESKDVKIELKQARRAEAKEEIRAALEQHQVVSASTPRLVPNKWEEQNPEGSGVGMSREQMRGGVLFGHVYEIVAATEDRIHLRNPWGHYARVDGQVLEDEAVSVLSWDEFFTVCDFYNVKG